MSVFTALRKEAKGSAEARGHRLRPFVSNWVLGRGTSTAGCFDCPMTVTVRLDPAPNETKISGEAVALTCTKPLIKWIEDDIKEIIDIWGPVFKMYPESKVSYEGYKKLLGSEDLIFCDGGNYPMNLNDYISELTKTSPEIEDPLTGLSWLVQFPDFKAIVDVDASPWGVFVRREDKWKYLDFVREYIQSKDNEDKV